jgi:hypothetical protein
MDSHGKDTVVARALALTLMRQALALLDAAGETAPAAHLQMAVDAMTRTTPQPHDDRAGTA